MWLAEFAVLAELLCDKQIENEKLNFSKIITITKACPRLFVTTISDNFSNIFQKFVFDTDRVSQYKKTAKVFDIKAS